MGISLWRFFIGPRATNSTVQGPIEPIRDFMGCLLSARMKKIQLKLKSLEWSQHHSLIFQTLKGSLLQ